VIVGFAESSRNGKAFGVLGIVAVAGTAAVLVAIRDDPERIAIAEVRVQSDDRTLELSLNSCNADPKVDVNESAGEVVIVVLGDPMSGADCADGVRARLAAPLGDRPIIDAATGLEIKPIIAR
jgi:hypothetical protein